MNMKLTFLGTGTSVGVPQIGCHCRVCQSSDPHDKRLRCSALLQCEGTNILIDCSPDFREQMLRIGFEEPLHAVLITHEHYDHVGGIDDLRPFSYLQNLPIYADEYTVEHLRERLPYCLVINRYPGVPQLTAEIATPRKTFHVRELEVMPLQVIHGKLPILGFRIGPLAYITDMTYMPEADFEMLRGIRMLVVNALRHEPHPTHQTVEEAITFSRKLGKNLPTYLIHMSHHLGLHAEEEARLPHDIHFAYDGLALEIEI